MNNERKLNENSVELPEAAIETKEDAFAIEEIEIEEMAIDGICGVY